mmetsp:Transcript_26470/g.50150  ORF Transcript_26470/g.50150 Transcript_26470/m.50150 type:complete len:250 (+) Transcript_26470:2363-3112(+)
MTVMAEPRAESETRVFLRLDPPCRTHCAARTRPIPSQGPRDPAEPGRAPLFGTLGAGEPVLEPAEQERKLAQSAARRLATRSLPLLTTRCAREQNPTLLRTATLKCAARTSGSRATGEDATPANRTHSQAQVAGLGRKTGSSPAFRRTTTTRLLTILFVQPPNPAPLNRASFWIVRGRKGETTEVGSIRITGRAQSVAETASSTGSCTASRATWTRATSRGSSSRTASLQDSTPHGFLVRTSAPWQSRG